MTRRRFLWPLWPLLAALAGLLWPAGATATQSLHASLGGGATFPAQSIVLSIPPQKSELVPSAVHITENGQAVAGETVTPIRLAPVGDYGIVLAIDSGPSMRGPAIDQAMAAARAIAAQRTAGQEMGLVTFAQAPTTKLALTQDSVAIQQALAQTPTLGGVALHPTASGAKAKHIYDGVQLALQQLTAAHITAGAVIVLSNGADQGSQSPLQSIATTAASSHIRIFTVGLRNRFFRPETLAALARVGGGSFTEADPSQLRRIFTGIETSLTSKYVVHYRSLQPYGQPIQIAVTVDGVPGSAAAAYTSAAAPPTLTTPKQPGGPHATHTFWTSTLALVIFASAGGLLLGLAVMILLVPAIRSGGVRARVDQFISSPTLRTRRSEPVIPTPVAAGLTERALERSAWWSRFKEEVEIARIERTPIELIYMTALGMVICGALLVVVIGSPLMILPVLIAGPVLLRAFVNHRLETQRRLFGDQLASHLQEVAAAMRAGHSIVGGFRVMADAAAEPTHGEFRRVLADEELGMPLDEAMAPLAKRMASEDINQVALIISLHRRAGGNVAEVLDRVASSVRERAELRRELRSLTAQARLSRWIVTALPPGILVVLAVVNPDYSRPLFNTTAGVVLLVIATGMVVTGSLVMRALVDIKP